MLGLDCLLEEAVEEAMVFEEPPDFDEILAVLADLDSELKSRVAPAEGADA